MMERNQNVVTMHDVSPLALRQLIDYAYSGEITITEDNVQVKYNYIFSFLASGATLGALKSMSSFMHIVRVWEAHAC